MRKWNFAAAVCLISPALGAAEPIKTALTHDAYVWQRAWTPAVRTAAQSIGTNFDGVVALHAEVNWNGGAPKVVRVPVDFSMLRVLPGRVGLALRIGAFHRFSGDSAMHAPWLADLAASLIEEARTNQFNPAELPIDFDCAESRLADYTRWIEVIGQRIAPTPVVITALPAWLNRKSFPLLARACKSFVLQVHSLERPKAATEPWTLCNMQETIRAVEKAGRLGMPFRVALPTYGYLLAFNQYNEFVGISAETPQPAWPEDVVVREVHADPAAIASLVSHWQTNSPPSMQGFIWYRLPIRGDKLNWHWPTLAAVMRGEIPRPKLQCAGHWASAGLLEIELVNQGTFQTTQRSIQVSVSWHGARLLAGDALHGFSMREHTLSQVHFISDRARVQAGERFTIGWIRFDKDTEVELELN